MENKLVMQLFFFRPKPKEDEGKIKLRVTIGRKEILLDTRFREPPKEKWHFYPTVPQSFTTQLALNELARALSCREHKREIERFLRKLTSHPLLELDDIETLALVLKRYIVLGHSPIPNFERILDPLLERLTTIAPTLSREGMFNERFWVVMDAHNRLKEQLRDSGLNPSRFQLE